MLTPPFGASLWIWESPVTTGVIREYAPKLAAWGFDFVELPLENPGDWDPRAVRDILREHGLEAEVCAAMAPGRDLITTDIDTVRETQDYLRACIDAAATIGGSIVAGPIYAPTGVTGAISDAERAVVIDRLADTLGPLLDHADGAAVQLALEPLNRFETSLFNTVEQAIALLKRVNRPTLGLLLDTFHMNIEERDIGAAMRAAGPYLIHFHASGNDRGTPGNDSIDWDTVRDVLDELDFAGVVSIESFTTANQAIATAASIWRPLAPSQDAIATEGLAFLRDLFA
jgi:D-psicose/D-tagatose/L-ribulose 3-epimerase